MTLVWYPEEMNVFLTGIYSINDSITSVSRLYLVLVLTCYETHASLDHTFFPVMFLLGRIKC